MKWLIFLLTLFLPLNAMANTYHVATDGSGDFTTIAQVNAASFNPNDQVLFNKGDTWRERLSVRTGVIYSSYGSGNKPKLLASKDLSGVGNWSEESSNIWVSNIIINTDVGILVFDNENSVGKKVDLKTDLDTQDEFWYDDINDVVYIYSTSNPDTYYNNFIEAGYFPATGQGYINLYNIENVTIDGLDIRYWGAHAISGTGTQNNISIKNCSFSYGGGCYLSGTTRFGSGIQFWDSASNIIIEKNIFDQIYDEAFTNQGNTDGIQSNITYRNNIYSRCWFGMTSAINVQDKIKVIHNTCINSSKSWSANQRTTGLDAESPARAVYFSHPATTGSVIKNNIFYDDGVEVNSHLVHLNYADLSTTDMDYNCYYKPNNTAFTQQTTNYTQAQFSDWQTTTSQDAHSIAADPKLTADYHLKTGSPCINTGVDVDVDTDYAGNPRNNPDIGAYEYGTFIHNATIHNATLN